MRAASGRSREASGRAGGSSGTSKSRPIALSMRRAPREPRHGRSGMGPDRGSGLRRAACARRPAARPDGRPQGLDRHARVRGRVRRVQPAARPGQHADVDLHRPARGRSPGRAGRWARVHPARAGGDPRDRRNRARRPATEGGRGLRRGRGGGGRRGRGPGRDQADRPATGPRLRRRRRARRGLRRPARGRRAAGVRPRASSGATRSRARSGPRCCGWHSRSARSRTAAAT